MTLNITQSPASPKNYNRNRQHSGIDRVVIHVTDGKKAGAISWFQNPAAQVSAHYVIGLDGSITQCVANEDTAWHAGDYEMNTRSIGIEHEGEPSKGPWTPSTAQLEASAKLVASLCETYGFKPDRVHIIGHNEVNPDRAARKNCPGPTWPWDRYIKLVQDAVKPEGQVITVRIFNAVTGKEVAAGTLVGQDKVYVRPEDLNPKYR